MRKIAIIGFDEDLCIDPKLKPLAKDLGLKLAHRGHVLLVGGGSGVMKAAVEGAHAAGGLTLSFVAGKNDHSNAQISLGEFGLANHSLRLICAADLLIAIGGGAGTLLEICVAYLYRKPIIAIKNTGGWVDHLYLTGRYYLDDRCRQEILFAEHSDEVIGIVNNLLDPSSQVQL